MSVNLKGTKVCRITDFSGGINQYDSTYMVRDNEFVEGKNVELRTGGSIKSRRAASHYQEQSYQSLTTAIKNMFRYTRKDGRKAIALFTDEKIYMDRDDGRFDLMSSGAVVSRDGFGRFTQWRDTLFFSTEDQGLIAINRDGAIDWINGQPERPLLQLFEPITSGSPNTTFNPFATINGVDNTANLGIDTFKNYSYRYTFDIYAGDDFIGETNPLWTEATQEYKQDDVTLTGAEDSFEFTRGAGIIQDIPDGALIINIYRAGPFETTGDAPSTFEKFGDFGLIGAVNMVTWFEGESADVLVTDLGADRIRFIKYDRVTKNPAGRFLSVHKSRMWVSNVDWYYYDHALSKQIRTNNPHRVYYSQINRPAEFRSLSFFDVGSNEGEGITGMISFKNKVLLIFKPNSVWAVAGGDLELASGEIDVNLELLSGDIGCVAPETIVQAEGGIIWLSHRGVFMYDGTVPFPLNTEKIDETLLDRPTAKLTHPCAEYNHRFREYWIAHSHKDTSSVFNKLFSKFSFRTKSWVQGSYTTGVASFVVKKSSLELSQILIGAEDTTASMSNAGAINRADYGGTDSDLEQAIDWDFTTKFFDCGTPFMDKSFDAILVQLNSGTNINVEVGCDSHLKIGDPSFPALFGLGSREGDQDFDSTGAAAAEDLIWDVSADSGDWSSGPSDGNSWAGDNNRSVLQPLNDKCWGKRIAFKFSGTARGDQDEVQAITIFYKPKEGVRQ